MQFGPSNCRCGSRPHQRARAPLKAPDVPPHTRAEAIALGRHRLLLPANTQHAFSEMPDRTELLETYS